MASESLGRDEIAHVEWGRPDPFGVAKVTPYRDSASLLNDLFAGVAELLEARPTNMFEQILRRTDASHAAAPPLARGICAWPLDRLSLEILAICLASELSPSLHTQLAPVLTPERVVELLGRTGRGEHTTLEVPIALHPASTLIDLDLIELCPGSPWFARLLRATPEACTLATQVHVPETLVGIRLPRQPDERLVEVFAQHADAVTVVHGSLAEVELAAACSYARIVAGGLELPRSTAGAIRDATISDAIPVLVTDRLDERVHRLLARTSGPRWVVIPSPELLGIATTSCL